MRLSILLLPLATSCALAPAVCDVRYNSDACMQDDLGRKELLSAMSDECADNAKKCKKNIDWLTSRCEQNQDGTCEMSASYRKAVEPVMKEQCAAHNPYACGDLGALYEEEKQPNVSLQFYTEGCKLNLGAACAYLAEYAGRLHLTNIERDVTPIAAYWLTEECAAEGRGSKACDMKRWFADRCDPRIAECKSLQLYMTKSRRIEKEQDLARQEAESRRRAAAWGAALKSIGDGMAQKPSVNCTSSTYGPTTYTNCH